MSAHSVRILASLTATMTLAAAFPALAIELPTKPYLTLEAARSVVAAAEKEATANGWPCVISVVDAEGLPILTIRITRQYPLASSSRPAKLAQPRFSVGKAALSRMLSTGLALPLSRRAVSYSCAEEFQSR